MHRAAFSVLGLDHRYFAFHVSPAGLPAALAGARALGLGGLNLTVPHKRAGCSLVDTLTPEAERIGAINTICIEGSHLVGHNTDGEGFMAGLRELAGGEPRRAVVLGSGGAARAVVDVLSHDARAELVWVSRRPGELPPGRWRAAGWTELQAALGGADLLVNATTVGMKGGPDEFPEVLPLSELVAGARVVDLVYPKRAGGLLDRASEHDLLCQDGLPMLLWQGVFALSRWLSMSLPADVVDAMRKAIGAMGRSARR